MPGLTDIIPIQGMKSAPHLDFAGEIRKATGFPTFHAARIQDVPTARHAIESGKIDMVGMTRAHMTDPHIVRKIIETPGRRYPAVRGRELLSRPYLSRWRGVLYSQCSHGPRNHDAARHCACANQAQGCDCRGGPGRTGSRPRLR
jgi:tRNA-dihydrouridine synthase